MLTISSLLSVILLLQSCHAAAPCGSPPPAYGSASTSTLSSSPSVITSLASYGHPNSTYSLPSTTARYSDSSITTSTPANATSVNCTVTRTSFTDTSVVTEQSTTTETSTSTFVSTATSGQLVDPRTYTGATTAYTDTFTTTTTTSTSTSTPAEFTATIPTPLYFVPVEESFPSATVDPAFIGFNPQSPSQAVNKRAPLRKRDCATTYTNAVATITTQVPPSTITNVDYALYITFPAENTGVEFSEYFYTRTYASATTVTRVSTITTQAVSVTTVAPVAGSTTSVYAACATNNFMSGTSNDTSDSFIIVSLPVNDQNSAPQPLDGNFYSAYDCCEAAINASARSWAFITDRCLLWPVTEEGAVCPARRASDPFLFQLEPKANFADYPKVVIGNGICGRIEQQRLSR